MDGELRIGEKRIAYKNKSHTFSTVCVGFLDTQLIMRFGFKMIPIMLMVRTSWHTRSHEKLSGLKRCKLPKMTEEIQEEKRVSLLLF